MRKSECTKVKAVTLAVALNTELDAAKAQREDERAEDTLNDLLEEALHNSDQEEDDSTCVQGQAERLLPAWQRASISVVTHRDFESIIIGLTVINCIALALYAPLGPRNCLPNVVMEQTGMQSCVG